MKNATQLLCVYICSTLMLNIKTIEQDTGLITFFKQLKDTPTLLFYISLQFSVTFEILSTRLEQFIQNTPSLCS